MLLVGWWPHPCRGAGCAFLMEPRFRAFAVCPTKPPIKQEASNKGLTMHSNGWQNHQLVPSTTGYVFISSLFYFPFLASHWKWTETCFCLQKLKWYTTNATITWFEKRTKDIWSGQTSTFTASSWPSRIETCLKTKRLKRLKRLKSTVAVWSPLRNLHNY